MNFESATRSVLRVGDGRGFIVDGAHDRFVITAAHCLPFLPPPMSFSSLEERTFLKLLAQLGCSPDVWAECFFVDPVSDLAIFGTPDSQELSEQFEAYEALLSEMETIKIRAAESRGKVWLLSLSHEWHACTAQHWGGALWYFDVVDGIHGGMSGSPAIESTGRAVGVVCASDGRPGEVHTSGRPECEPAFIFRAGFSTPHYDGRPRVLSELQHLARNHAPEVIAELAASGPKSTERDRPDCRRPRVTGIGDSAELDNRWKYPCRRKTSFR